MKRLASNVNAEALTDLERWALIVAVRSLRSGRSAITEARSRRRGKRRVVVTTGVEVTP